MIFDHSFFLPEVREGFYISTPMKRFWAAQMEIMQKIIEVCMINDIKIFVDYGTLLGTVRHAGFIPWDDDIDVVIFRKDQKRLFQLLKQEYGDKWEILEAQDINYLQPWYRINNSTELLFEEADLVEYHGCPYRAGVDIYILDNIPVNEEENAVVRNLFEIIYGLCFDKTMTDHTKEQALIFLDECFDLKVDTDDATDLKRILLTLGQELLASYDKNEMGKLIKLDAGGYGSKLYDAEWFEDVLWMPFESIYVPVPVGYEKILQLCFGSGYMNAVIGRALHDYPGFKEQEREYALLTSRNIEYHVDERFLLEECNRRFYEKKEKNIVVFIPCQVEKWKEMEPFWRKAIADRSNKVYVVPSVLYERDELGNRCGIMKETGCYPDHIHIINDGVAFMDTLDIDEIYIQQPYDDMCDAFDVDDRFFSVSLRKRCKRLIYVVGLELRDDISKDSICYKTFEYFVPMPGVVYSDETIVRSEMIRRMYIEYLSEWAGSDSRTFWEEKVISQESFLSECE